MKTGLINWSKRFVLFPDTTKVHSFARLSGGGGGGNSGGGGGSDNSGGGGGGSGNSGGGGNLCEAGEFFLW